MAEERIVHRCKHILGFVIILMLFVFVTLPVAASPTSKQLKRGTTYKLDLTGDGQKESFKYMKYTSRKLGLSCNGRIDKFKADFDGNVCKAKYVKFDKNNIFIFVQYSSPNAIMVSKAFRYNNGKFRIASETIGAYERTEITKISDSFIDVTTSYPHVRNSISFKGLVNPFLVTEKYYLNRNTHMIARKSNYGTINGNVTCYYQGSKTIKLSTSGKTFNQKGPSLKFGDKVKLLRVYFKYTGTDAQKGEKIYELSLSNGKKGWIKESEGIQFSSIKVKAKTRYDIYDEVFSKNDLKKALEDFAKKYNGGTIERDSYYDELERYDYNTGFITIIVHESYVYDTDIWDKSFDSIDERVGCFGVFIGMDCNDAIEEIKKRSNIIESTLTNYVDIGPVKHLELQNGFSVDLFLDNTNRVRKISAGFFYYE